MARSNNSRKRLTDIRDALLDTDDAFRDAWEATAAKRDIAAGLVRLRREAGLNQRQLAQRAGWDPAFVSRLESVPATGDVSLPDIRTLVTYARACNSELSLLFSSVQTDRVHISESVTLGNDRRFAAALDQLEGQDLDLAEEGVASDEEFAAEA